MVLGSGRFPLRAPILAVDPRSGRVLARHERNPRSGSPAAARSTPSRCYVGVFWQSPDIGGRFRIRPGIDGGFGDGLRLGTSTSTSSTSLPLGQGPWKFVTGGGPTIVLIRFADDQFDTGTEVTRRRQLPARLLARQRVLHRVSPRRRQRARAEVRRRVGDQDALARRPGPNLRSARRPTCDHRVSPTVPLDASHRAKALADDPPMLEASGAEIEE